MATIIKETQSIKEAMGHISTIDINKFSRLLSRIMQKLHLKTERPFSEEEEEKLQSALALEKPALTLVLETISFILEQAVYHNTKPAALKQQLEAVGMDSDKADTLCQAWSSGGPEIIERIRERIFSPKKLEHVGWQMSLQMGQSDQAKLKAPHAVLDLGLQNEDTEERENLQVEFNHQQLLEFYHKLETIQAQLDSLT
ncbi:COMM domain-containing protein 10 [Engraulis encrasicolus]|uniref:COMM domain-containing protein 10 n=1 Tax=Engraulis encrasicolus TaxID=184585 RepID=UPI002FD67031